MTIYFIEMERTDSIKIGYTAGPVEKRIAQLKTGQPNKIKLIGTIPGGRDGETELHKEFNHLRGNGEWFEKCPELMNVITFLVENQHPWYFCRARRSVSDVWGSAFRMRSGVDKSAHDDCMLVLSRNSSRAKAIRLRVAAHKKKYGSTPEWATEALKSASLNEDAKRANSYIEAWAV